MTTPMGAASPLGQPGARSGYFQIIRPPLSMYYVPGFTLHPGVIAAAAAGSFILKFGTLLAVEKSSGMLKVAVKTVANAGWEVDATPVSANDQGAIVGPIYPSLNTLYDPSIQGSGSVAVPFTNWFDGQTDQVDLVTPAWTPVAGDPFTCGVGGKVAKAAAGDPVVGIVKQVQSQISGVPGGALVNVLTLSYKGTDLSPWIF
jgi:hypothetical protein